MDSHSELEQKYLDLLVKRIKVCSSYKPKFGQGLAVSLEGFQQLSVFFSREAFVKAHAGDLTLPVTAYQAAGHRHALIHVHPHGSTHAQCPS